MSDHPLCYMCGTEVDTMTDTFCCGEWWHYHECWFYHDCDVNSDHVNARYDQP